MHSLKKEIDIIFFTYKSDELCLEQSIRAIRKTFPEATVYIYDDALYPVDTFYRELGDVYTQTHFKRNGNLKGKECCLGMYNIFNNHKNKYIIKVDSDTLVTGKDWLEPLLTNQCKFLGFTVEEHGFPYVCGPCYAFHSSIMPPIIKMAELTTSFNRMLHWPEDYVLGRLAALYLNDSDYCVQHINKSPKRFSGWIYSNAELNGTYYFMDYLFSPRFESVEICTFGNRNLIDVVDNMQKREIAANAMKEYLNYKYDKTLPADYKERIKTIQTYNFSQVLNYPDES